MKSLRAAAAISALTFPVALTPATFGLASGANLSSASADKNSDLIAKFENPEERAAALAEIKKSANKTSSKVRTYLMKQVGSSDPEMAKAALEAVIFIGQPMTRAVKTTLAKGEYKGVPIADSVAARIALRIDPTGKRMLREHVQTQPLTKTVAAEISRYAEPQAALDMLVAKAHEEASRPVSLATLRNIRQRGAFTGIEDLKKTLLEQTEELDETLTQVLVDSVVDVNVDEDYGRMEEWLGSGNPTQIESALWSIGGAGQPFMDIAPQLAAVLTTEQPAARRAAHWALRRFAADPTGGPDARAREAEAKAMTDREVKKAQEQMGFFRVLKEAQDGVLQLPGASIDPKGPDAPTGVELAAEAVAHWKFAPTWIAVMGDSFVDTEFARDVPAWNNDSIPSQIEELMPTLAAALASEDRAINVPAGLSLIEWNVKSIDLLRWAVNAVGTETDHKVLSPIWSFLVRESEQPWMKRTLATTALANALKNEATEVQTVKLLTRMNTESTRKLLVEHLANSSSTRVWDIQHYLTLYSLLALNREDRAKFSTVLGRRFMDGDYLVAPLLALAAESAHPAMEEALASPILDRRMIALAILVDQGTRARALLPQLAKLREEKVHAQAFREESMKTIETGQ